MEENQEQPKTGEPEGQTVPPSGTKTHEPGIKNAWKQVENIGQALGDALQGRGNVVMVRINDEALRYLDMLVEADVVKSRSEAAAWLINEGVGANQNLFQKIGEVTEQISALREKLRETVKTQKPDDD
ncbi:MAG: hypothetical protein RBT01_05505 [Anaerolineaceae bacterium]|jgi:hypothetical protein|nr:hypothetical protein [Anaerolineaceae bacterium]